MGKSYQVLYCDESSTHGSGSFYFGALVGSPRRAEILREALTEVRVKFGLTREMKWTKVSTQMFLAYKAFVDVFFEDPFAYFKILEVIRDITWKNWAPTEEQRFFKSYYVFLRRNMSPLCRYEVHLDYKTGRPYSWRRLYYAINAAAQRDYDVRQKQIHTLRAKSSKQEDLLQLVDLLLGASVSNATSTAKSWLAAYVKKRAEESTRSGKRKIEREDWVPTRNPD